MESEQNLIYMIEQIERGVRRPFFDVVAKSGMGVAGYTALTVLQRLPGLTSSELARRSFVRAQTMAQTITVLEESGLIYREADPAHGRQILLYITPLGIERIDSVAHEIRALEDQLVRYLTPIEANILSELLRRVRKGLREQNTTRAAEQLP